MTPSPVKPVDRFFSAEDGLRLHAREWPSDADATPVVCLPGLARTAADFEALAQRLSGRRRVVALDYRGRGLSDRDPEWRHYNLMIENADILSVATAMGIGAATFIGTSRGGLHIMMLSATRPTILHAAVLNDIGPVIEAQGLARIRGYVGKLPTPRSWAEAADIARHTMSEQFNGLSNEEFADYARLTFEEKNGAFQTRYDPALMKTLDGVDFTQPLPTMWPQFDGLRAIPLLVLRGQNSDLLSADTVSEMARHHPNMESHTVPGQGHAPLLLDAPSIERIATFVDKVDRRPD